MIRHITHLLMLALALATIAAHAQKPVYRSVMPDGKIVYGDKPAPGAQESNQVNLPPPNIVAPTPRSAAPQTAPGAAAAGTADVRKAQEAVDAARAALEAGREPQENERTGVARKGGGATSQLNDAYYQRIKTLEGAVAAAQARLDAAQRAGR